MDIQQDNFNSQQNEKPNNKVIIGLEFLFLFICGFLTIFFFVANNSSHGLEGLIFLAILPIFWLVILVTGILGLIGLIKSIKNKNKTLLKVSIISLLLFLIDSSYYVYYIVIYNF
ncbi:MAG: hypothetical protein QG630_312 [Patescibacteria group bacterium]|nr:hypothetical protein [Patescibacteria group bacterium]